jgi:hypothetical protein
MEFVIGAVIVIVIAGLIIYKLRDEDYHGWDD